MLTHDHEVLRGECLDGRRRRGVWRCSTRGAATDDARADEDDAPL
jgi:hypothetical protein